MHYLVGQLESCEETGRLHWQGYVEFKIDVTRKRAKSLLYYSRDHRGIAVHISSAKGNALQNKRYCHKDSTCANKKKRFEHGQPLAMEQGKRSDLRDLRRDALDDSKSEYTVATTNDAYPRHIRFFTRLRYLHGREQTRACHFRELSVSWYWGDPGLGKSRRAMFQASSAPGAYYRKPSDTKWWDGYEGQPNIIIDDITGGSGMSVGTWKRLLDVYPEQVEVKGGYTPWRAERIWITSNYSPEEWIGAIAESVVDKEALRRRISHVIHFTEPWEPPAQLRESSDDDSDDSNHTAASKANTEKNTQSQGGRTNWVDSEDEPESSSESDSGSKTMEEEEELELTQVIDLT